MREWTDWMNPFNPQKILLWREHLEGCAYGDYLSPISANIYLTNLCNHRCIWCINWGWRQKSPASMPEGHPLRLADFLKEWGIKSVCIGGGESTLHDEFAPFLYRLKENGIQVGVATNGGSHLSEEKLKAMAECCTWVGFSIDAGTAEVYSQLHQVDIKELSRVLANMSRLVEMGADVTYKMLWHPLNIPTVYEAAQIAKNIGASGLTMRPVGWENVARTQRQPPLDFKLLLPILEEQIEAARGLESDGFRVHAVTQKFGKELETTVRFTKCWAAPLTITASADGFWCNCCDVMDREWNKLCPHYPDPGEILRFWNSEQHKALVSAIDPKQCPRCTFQPYQEIIENVIAKDQMMVNFP